MDGQAGTSGFDGGGGGGGGYNGYGGRSGGTGAGLVSASSTFTGGAGGAGGAGGIFSNISSGSFSFTLGGGGGGGAGGYGAVVSGKNIQNAATLLGGAGGAGGGPGNGGVGGAGGDGGAGLVATATDQTITNTGSITGGNGGAGGSGAPSGGGGAGVIGYGLTVINEGTIAGGMNGAGTDAVTFTGGANRLALGVNPTFKGALDIQFGTLTFDQSAGANLPSSVVISNTIKGTGAVIVGTPSGTADTAETVQFSVANTYTGGTTIDSYATLAVDSDSELGGPTSGLKFSGGTLETTGTFTSARMVNLNTTGTAQVDSGTTTLSGVVGGSGTLTKTGTGTLTLSGANTYTGNVTITAGTLSAGATGNLGDSSAGLTFAGGTLETTGTLTSANAVTLDADGNVQTDSGTATLSGAIGGNFGLVKTGAGTLQLSGASTYTGNTSVNAGTLSISSDGNLGATSGGVTLLNSTLETTAAVTSARGVDVSGSGTIQVDSGVTTTLSGIVADGASTGLLFKNGGGTLTLSGANTYSGGTQINAGTLAISSDSNLGAFSALTFGGGTLETTANVSSGRLINLGQTGQIQVDSGVTTTLSGRISGGAGLTKTGAGTLTFSNGGNNYSGTTTIAGGVLDLAARVTTTQGPAGTGAITFQAATGFTATLALDSVAQPASGGTFGTTLNDFGSADRLDLKGLTFNASTTVTYDSSGHVLTVSNGTTTERFNLTNETPGFGGMYYAQDDGAGGTQVDNVVCFASGTLIRTARGDVAVEMLAVGDLAVTASGAARPIKWIGTRSFDCSAHPEPAMVRPIRVAAGTFGAGRPYRDLTLSPHHAVGVTVLDEVLIPIRLLVNGSSVKQIEDASAVTYWHVELDSHDILIANGLPAESYIDVGNRCDFEGGATLTLYPRFESDPLAAYCRPLVTGGSVLGAVRAQLALLAGGATIPAAAHEPTFRLLVDGTPIAPVMKDHQAAFVVPAGAKDIRLVSPTWSPRDTDRASPDDRRLGLMIEALAIDDLLGTITEIPLDHPALVAGFHPVERNADGRWRWTEGDARIAASLLPHAGSFVLRLRGRFATPRIATGHMATAA